MAGRAARGARGRAAVGVVLCAAALSGCVAGLRRFEPEVGDLLLQDLDLGPLCDAIEDVTEGYRGARFSHVGIVARGGDGRLVVLEAVSAGVQATRLDEFLARSHDAAGRPKVVVGRLRPAFRGLTPRAVKRAEALLGKPYDRVFAIGNDRYYCSELVYEVFRFANDGRPVFDLAPMTFRAPRTGVTLPAWAGYFEELGAPIPEGRPGINPGAISRSPKIEIVQAYGTPDGW